MFASVRGEIECEAAAASRRSHYVGRAAPSTKPAEDALLYVAAKTWHEKNNKTIISFSMILQVSL